ncbi:putative quinol monooxygenase [Crenalkalicoccus roseus]|uniref:putative quinol monooxygenase n=1 Tax=Crenalkalicoccus roseus TaxID=1485588 RepID=UPI001F014AAD|nr:putative quinol monooxygenase [Crenalkalicoccus roseus]
MTRREAMGTAALAAAGAAAAREAGAEAAAGPLALIVSLRVRPGREAEFLRLLLPVLDAMRHEPGFLNAVLHRDPEDPARFMLYETWADRRDLVEVQMRRPYRAPYEARLPELLDAPREVRIWRPLRADFAHFAPAGAVPP